MEWPNKLQKFIVLIIGKWIFESPTFLCFRRMLLFLPSAKLLSLKCVNWCQYFFTNFKYENLTWILFRKMKFLYLFREFLVWWKIIYENYDDSLLIFGQFLSCSTFLHTHILCSKLSIFLDFGYDLWTNKTILKVHKRSLTNFKWYFIWGRYSKKVNLKQHSYPNSRKINTFAQKACISHNPSSHSDWLGQCIVISNGV